MSVITQWVEKIPVIGSTGKQYAVSRHKDGWWGCSCTGWTTNRKCKHLTSRGLSSEGCPPTNKQLKEKLQKVQMDNLALQAHWEAEKAKAAQKAPVKGGWLCDLKDCTVGPHKHFHTLPRADILEEIGMRRATARRGAVGPVAYEPKARRILFDKEGQI